MNDNEFYATCWKVAGAVVCSVILAASGCSISNEVLVSHDIANGADPIAAGCAHSSGAGTVCVIYSARRGVTP